MENLSTKLMDGCSQMGEVKRSRFPPALALFLLSPVIGELLSGSSPPVEFFSPFGLTVLLALYGSGAVVVRELRVRWHKGVGSVLLLGAAYGVLEEGLMVTSWFSPFWVDLGVMGVYGRWLGVNWVWAEMLTIYHAVFSITVPILLVKLAFPNRREERWVGKKLFAVLVVVLGVLTVFGNILFSYMMKYWTPLPQLVFGVALMVFFGYLAHRLRADWSQQGQRALPKPRVFWVVSTVVSFAFFLGFYTLPSVVPWQVLMLYGPLLVFVLVRFLRRYNWREKISDMHVLALTSGALSWMIVFAVLQELDKTRPDNTTGMSLVALTSVAGLVLFRQKVKKRISISQTSTQEKWL